MAFAPPRRRWQLHSHAQRRDASYSVAHPHQPPVALTSASATLDDLGLGGWQFHQDTSGGNSKSEMRGACSTRITMELSTLVGMLTAPSSAQQRHEWARRLVLDAQENVPDSEFRHLYTSIGREGWDSYRLRMRREAARQSPEPPQYADSSANGEEREMLAAELNHLVAQFRRAISAQQRLNAPKNMLMSAQDLAKAMANETEQEEAEPDVLRVAPAPFAPMVPSDAAMPRTDPARPQTWDGGSGADSAVLLSQPTWDAVGADGSRLQSTLRFDPGIGHGDRILVTGPDGFERLPLVAPMGMMNVQRVLASVPGIRRRSNARSTAAAAASTLPPGTALRIDIVPLGPRAAPGSVIVVDGIEIVLPSYVAPYTSLVLALPFTPDQGGWAARAATASATAADRGRRAAAASLSSAVATASPKADNADVFVSAGAAFERGSQSESTLAQAPAPAPASVPRAPVQPQPLPTRPSPTHPAMTQSRPSEPAAVSQAPLHRSMQPHQSPQPSPQPSLRPPHESSQTSSQQIHAALPLQHSFHQESAVMPPLTPPTPAAAVAIASSRSGSVDEQEGDAMHFETSGEFMESGDFAEGFERSIAFER